MEPQIIIATGDSQFRDDIKRVCYGQNCRVETADTVATALKIAARRPICVMVADVSIQNIGDGLELAKTIHDHNPDAKCFLIVDEESSDVLSSVENEPWLRFVFKTISMVRFTVDVVEAIKESKVRN